MSYKLSSIDYLDQLGITYAVKEFPVDTEKGTANIAAQFNQEPRIFLKTLIFEDEQGELLMTLVGGDQNVVIGKLQSEIKGKVKLASPKTILESLGYSVGSVPPFGLKKSIPVFVDSSLRDEKDVAVGAGQWGVELFISQKNLMTATSGQYVNIVKESERTDWDKLYLPKKHLPRIKGSADLKPAVLLKDISKFSGKIVSLNGWVYNKRTSGKIMFLQFRDGSGDIQAVIEKAHVKPEVWEDASELTTESSMQLTGTVQEDKRSPFGYELKVDSLTIIQIAPEYPISKKAHGPDFLMDNRHLWLRSRKQRAVLKIRDELFFSLTSFLRKEGFTRVDTPIFQPVSCEDASELFEVDYFGEKTYLTQSGQLYSEAAEFALGRTYDFGPVFRAEKSKTRKHLIEFWMMDAELPFTNLEGMMDFEEKLIKQLIKDCLHNCKYEFTVLERDTPKLRKVLKEPFIRMSHKETIDLLNKKFKQKLEYLDDIGAPEEAKLSELYDIPIFITDWPADIKAFYMPQAKSDNNALKRVRAVDLIAPEGAGEIIGGAEREFDYNKILDTIREKGYNYNDYKWYLDLRKYGTIPHSGFGIGLERTVRWITGVKHIRETILFPRMLNRLYP